MRRASDCRERATHSPPGLGREPSAAELAAEVGVSEADLASLESTIARAEEETAAEPESSELEASEARLLLAGAFRTP